MKVKDLMENLQALGVELIPCGDELHFHDERGAMSPDIERLIARYRPAILRELRRRRPSTRPTATSKTLWRTSRFVVFETEEGLPFVRFYKYRMTLPVVSSSRVH